MKKAKTLIPQTLKNLIFHLPKAILALIRFQFPASKLTVIGITGSDGKTTTTHLAHHLLNNCGIKTAMISTVAAKLGDQEIDTGFHVTSPDPFLLQAVLRKIVNLGFTHVILEATSHGLDQFRLLGTNIAVAVVTNVTHEHLDYHKTPENYLKTKAKIFRTCKYAIVNKDDKSYKTLTQYIPKSAQIITYGLAGNSQLRAFIIAEDSSKTTFRLRWGKVNLTTTLPIPGRYNVQNALASIAIAKTIGVNPQTAASHLASFAPVRGRLNRVRQNPDVYIDFAHTPNALEQVLTLLKNQLKPTGKLIAVFGCAGERDKNKRPIMGKSSVRLANLSIFTSEDPRTEQATDIIEQMAHGARKVGAYTRPEASHLRTVLQNQDESRRHYFTSLVDRQSAINLALSVAHQTDTVIVAGKGHEQSMNYGKGELPWSDYEGVERYYHQLQK